VVKRALCKTLILILGLRNSYPIISSPFFAMKEELYYMIVEYIKHVTGTLDYNIVLTLCKAQLKT